MEDPDYQSVCTGKTGHIEVVQVAFDSEVTSYRETLEVCFAVHDPTSLDRQGNDSGTQYRSAIFYHDDQQRNTAEQLINELDREGIWRTPIVTEVRSRPLCEAEAYHQDYFPSNPQQPSAHLWWGPRCGNSAKSSPPKCAVKPKRARLSRGGGVSQGREHREQAVHTGHAQDSLDSGVGPGEP